MTRPDLTSVRNTQQSSDMVELVAKEIASCIATRYWRAYTGVAKAVLDVCHHAELVEALERASARARLLARLILSNYELGVCDDQINALNELSRDIDADLAKIGGDV